MRFSRKTLREERSYLGELVIDVRITLETMLEGKSVLIGTGFYCLRGGVAVKTVMKLRVP